MSVIISVPPPERSISDGRFAGQGRARRRRGRCRTARRPTPALCGDGMYQPHHRMGTHRSFPTESLESGDGI